MIDGAASTSSWVRLFHLFMTRCKKKYLRMSLRQ